MKCYVLVIRSYMICIYNRGNRNNYIKYLLFNIEVGKSEY